MESNITSSFIPHDTARGGGHVSMPSAGSLGELMVLGSIVLFVASAALGIAMFLYVQFEQSSIASKTGQLERAQAAFEPALVQELTRLDDRMQAAQTILHTHMAPSMLFSLMQNLTLTTVSFKSLDFQAVDDKTMTLALKGVAKSVNSVALQADLFGKNNAIVNPVFSNINRTAEGVEFDVSAYINPAAFNFEQKVQAATTDSGGQQGGAQQTSPSTQSVTSPGAQATPLAPAKQ